MPETASLSHMLTPVKPANESGRNLKPDSAPYAVMSDRADSVINDDNPIPGRPTHKADHGSEDFGKVLSRKINRQKEQTPDEHSQENAAPAETAGLNPTQCPGCSDSGYENNPLGNIGEQSASTQAGVEMNNTPKNAADVQLVADTGILGETMDPVNQPNGQLPGQAQEGTVQPAVPQGGLDQEKPVPANITAEAKLPVDGKQAYVQKPVMAERADVSGDNNTESKQFQKTGSGQVQNAESKQFQVSGAMEQVQKQLSDAPDSEIRPVRADQGKSIRPDPQPVLRGTQQEQRQDLRPQSDNSNSAGQFQDETPDAKDPQGVPFEAETFSGGHDETPKGFEIRNAQSMLHSAEPAENASLSALEAPARTGIHSNIPQAETAKPVDQILQHLSSISVSGAQQRIKLTLTPEHLGTIRITFNQTEDEVVGLLEVQKNQTRREVEQSLPQLISAMQSSGVQVRKIEVVQWNASQDSVEDETAKRSDYSAADQFHGESSPNSSESGVPGNVRSAGHDQKSSQLSGISEQEGPIDGVETTESGLNMFV